MIEDLVTVKRSKRARRVALRLDPVEQVINLIVPNKMSLKKAYNFAREHENWVIDTLGKLAPPIPFHNGATIPVFGDKIELIIEKDPARKRTSLKQFDDILQVNTYQDDPSNRIKNHLKKISKTGLADLASEKADMIGKTIKNVSVRDTKSRWGSCSEGANISFSWRLIFAPYEAMDYVVAHEVAHLVHMNHSKDFWALCRDLSCDFLEGKYWMKNHGNELMRYGKSL